MLNGRKRKVRGFTMPAVFEKSKRENLFQEISGAIRQWPELDRKIFIQAHYQGKSLEIISRSFQLDVAEVSEILRQCDRRLQASLRSFRRGGYEKPLNTRVETAFPSSCRQDFCGTPAPAPKVKQILEATKIPA